MLQLFDRVALDAEGQYAPRKTRDGYLVAMPITARTGIQVYAGFEVDPNNAHGMRDRARVLIYRPEEEVFSADAVASMAHRPITNDHPPVLVTADNWKEYSTGQTGGEALRDGDRLRTPMALMDGAQVRDVLDGKRQLSWGYTCTIDFTPGTSPDGVAFDGRQKNIRGNHLAVVDAARAGPEFRLFDSAQQKEQGMTLRTIMVDGITIQATDQAVEAIGKLQGLLTQADAKLQSNAGTIAAMTQTHAEAITAKDAEIAALKATVPDAVALDAMVVARTALMGAARKILGDAADLAGKGDADIRRAAVAKKLGDAFVAGKGDEFVSAAFDAITLAGDTGDARNGQDPIADALRTAPVPPASAQAIIDDAYKASVASMQDAWKKDAA